MIFGDRAVLTGPIAQPRHDRRNHSGTTVKSLAVVLVLAVILFVALVIVPQLQQAQCTGPGVAASADQPLGASGLIGSWTLDFDAYWTKLLATPELARKAAGMTPVQLAAWKGLVEITVPTVSWHITADTLAYNLGGVRFEETYAITSTSGDVITTHCVDSRGPSHQVTFTVNGDRMDVAHPTFPDLFSTLRRVR
jgi:hypothetical protein